MSVVIQFDKPNTWQYTNLDLVDGRVILILQSDSTISAINVKLEGESRTRLAGPRQPYNDRSDKTRTELEVHKARTDLIFSSLNAPIAFSGLTVLQLLYKVQTVFPSPEIRREKSASSNYTLLAGQYEYPFRFKVRLYPEQSAQQS
jgi:hypothetical protein